ncbi:MAG: HAMP domain-containing sensor histidine kinase, partial [Patescibacteria group bacterium]
LGRLNWSVSVRYAVILIILVVALLGNAISFTYDLGGIFVAVALAFIFNVASSFVYTSVRYPRAWPYLGIFVDMLVITIVVHYTGGVASIFLPLYVLQIVGSNVHFSKWAGPINFVFGGMVFVGLLLFEYAGYIPHLAQPYLYGAPLFHNASYIIALSVSMLSFMGISTYRSGYVVYSLTKVERKLFELNDDLLRANRAFALANRRLKEIDQMKNEFISVASHQLRTPLSAIKWVLKMMMDGDVGTLNAEQQDLLAKGYQSNERMILLINDLLNVSRIEEGRFQYRFSHQDLHPIIQRVIDEMSGDIRVRGVKFTYTPPAMPFPRVYVDEQKMHLVVQNMIDNAIKYTPKGGSITVAMRQQKDRVEFSVTDTGAGIPVRQQDRIFSKFFRADNVIRMQTEGSGLGLFIVKNIVESHHGEVSFESKEGIGSTFRFTLPAEGGSDASFDKFISSL